VSHTDVTGMYQRCLLWEAAAVLRHDLRNRLASVRNAAFYVRRRIERDAASLLTADARVPVFFELMGKELDAADALISEWIADGGRMPSLEPIDLAQAIDDAVAAIRNPDLRIERSTTNVRALAMPELAVAIFCLVENAVDATSAQATGTVHVGCRSEAGRAIVVVSDAAGGMTDDVARQAMQPSFSTRPGRLGFGLAIVKRLVQRARGTFQIENHGPGVRATIDLPEAPP